MWVVKILTENANNAESFEYKGKQRVAFEGMSMKEFTDLSHADRLTAMDGKEVLDMDDSRLFAGLESYSYYRVKPIMIGR